MSYYGNTTPLSSLVGLTAVSYSEGAHDGLLTLTLDDGRKAVFYHSQDCCESVDLNEVHGDLDDLLNTPILQAEEVSGEDPGPPSEYYDSYTWTFYKLATIKGHVTLRFLGESNGYYSESVDFRIDEVK